ncbi:MAG: NAD(P)-dependent oxidoreductase [Planctomycetaceae bacterium]
MQTQTSSAVDAFSLTSVRFRLFGAASWKYLLTRFAADFAIANIVLVASCLLRLVANGSFSSADPVGSIVGRVNSVYLMNAVWFGATAVVLLCLTGFYRPRPSSRVGERLAAVAKACAAGAALHIAFGILLLRRDLQPFQLAFIAWALLFGAIALTRVSRISLSSYFRFVPRVAAAGTSHVEDVLVVGGAGYVGSELVRQLLKSGYRVRVLDLQMFGLKPLEDLLGHRRLEVMKGDFRNVEHVVKALRGMDAVIHLAAIVGDPACAIDKNTTIAVNYQAARMMAQMARANGISRFVFASTCSVYGDASDQGVISEGGVLNPVSLYATTKIDAEKALLETADDVFQPTILRFGTAYGLSSRPRFDLVANLFSARAVAEGEISVFNGHYSRPFVHVRDMARACQLMLESPLHLVGCEIFNVGDESQNYTISELGQMVAQHVPGTIVHESCDDSDPRSYRVSFEKIRSTLGFRASVDVSEGVREMVEAVRSGRIGDWRDPVYSNKLQMEEFALNLLTFPQPQISAEQEMPATSEFLRKAA